MKLIKQLHATVNNDNHQFSQNTTFRISTQEIFKKTKLQIFLQTDSLEYVLYIYFE